eukprot:362682-Chlamydomonas_euryale.AAC.1
MDLHMTNEERVATKVYKSLRNRRRTATSTKLRRTKRNNRTDSEQHEITGVRPSHSGRTVCGAFQTYIACGVPDAQGVERPDARCVGCSGRTMCGACRMHKAWSPMVHAL